MPTAAQKLLDEHDRPVMTHHPRRSRPGQQDRACSPPTKCSRPIARRTAPLRPRRKICPQPCKRSRTCRRPKRRLPSARRAASSGTGATPSRPRSNSPPAARTRTRHARHRSRDRNPSRIPRPQNTAWSRCTTLRSHRQPAPTRGAASAANACRSSASPRRPPLCRPSPTHTILPMETLSGFAGPTRQDPVQDSPPRASDPQPEPAQRYDPPVSSPPTIQPPIKRRHSRFGRTVIQTQTVEMIEQQQSRERRNNA